MELSLGGSFGGLSLLADLGDRIPDDRRPCQHLISSCPAKMVHPTCLEGIDYKTCFGLICADIQIQIAKLHFSNSLQHFKFSATFQILCTISNLLLGFEFCAASLVWWQMGRMNIVKTGEGDWRRSRRRKKVNQKFSTLGPLVLKTLNYQTQPHCTDPEHRLQLQHFLCVLNYQHHHLLKWIVTKNFFSVLTAFCSPRLEPGSLVCFEYPLPSDRFSLKMIHVKEM